MLLILSVVTELTTEVSKGLSHTRTGKRFESIFADGELVGVAVVKKTSQFFVNWLLSLPSDAITEMPVHLSFGCTGMAALRKELCG